jgi:hypothetical protein
LNPGNGLQIFDPYQNKLRTTLRYDLLQMLNTSTQLVFSVNSAAGITTMATAVITNSGNLVFYAGGTTNLCTITGSTGAIKIRGVDSDTRYPLAPTAMTAFVATNIIGTVTQRLWYTAQGVVTNHIP